MNVREHGMPFRVNLSKGGVGFSVGGGGLRTGVSSQGRRYSTFNLPGTGMGYRTSGKSGCLLTLAAPVAFLIWKLTT